MKTLEINKTGLHFQSWGELYCGCKANWITPEDVLVLLRDNKDELSDIVFDYIPSKFFKIWELEFLMEIINSPLLVSEKLNQVALLFDEMNYPEEWKPFLFYQQQKDYCL